MTLQSLGLWELVVLGLPLGLWGVRRWIGGWEGRSWRRGPVDGPRPTP